MYHSNASSYIIQFDKTHPIRFALSTNSNYQIQNNNNSESCAVFGNSGPQRRVHMRVQLCLWLKWNANSPFNFTTHIAATRIATSDHRSTQNCAHAYECTAGTTHLHDIIKPWGIWLIWYARDATRFTSCWIGEWTRETCAHFLWAFRIYLLFFCSFEFLSSFFKCL